MAVLERFGRLPVVLRDPPTLREWRCRQCRRLLMLVNLAPGSAIECQCRCGCLNVLTVDEYQE